MKEKIDAFFVSHPPNVRYLSGFKGHDAYLLISQDAQYLLTDFRLAGQAAKEAKGFTVELWGDSLTDLLNGLLSRHRLGRLGIESSVMTVERHRYFRRRLKGISLKPVAGLAERLRLIKDERELKAITRAAGLGDRAFQHILPFLKAGVTEREIALELEFFMRRNGSEAMGFEVIVASGMNSACPHAAVSGKKLKAGELVKLDFGATVDGYHSDMTRTVVLGKASEKQKRIYTAVMEAQKAVLSQLKAGLTAAKGDQIARESLAQAGLAERFGHNLGHGVGLEVHEAPTLGRRSKEKLQTGMVFTVEPGVYLPGFGGVRIEDTVVLEPEGLKILTRAPKELLEL